MLLNRLIPFFSCAILLFGIGCSTSKSKTSDKSTQFPKPVTLNGKIVIKAFVNKVGETSQTMQDLYFETSEDFYFIKFTESEISDAEAMAVLNKPIGIEGEIREGFWDVSDDEGSFVQSRSGPYLVITKVLN